MAVLLAVCVGGSREAARAGSGMVAAHFAGEEDGTWVGEGLVASKGLQEEVAALLAAEAAVEGVLALEEGKAGVMELAAVKVGASTLPIH
jgi:hypothetical protein